MLSKRTTWALWESKTIFRVLSVILILLLASGIRILVLDDRPFHNDEGVNFFFIRSMFKDGFYKYSHENYHGPIYFYLTALFEWLIGDNEYGHRMSAVVASVGIVITPLFLGSLASFRSKIYSMLLLALSSSILYYGRYAIHESFLVFVSLSFSIYLFKWLETRDRIDLLWIGLYLGLLVATKETCIIYIAATGAAAVLIYGPMKVFGQLFRHYDYFLIGLLICLFIISLLFSGFFRHPAGLRELLFGIQQWVGRGHSDKGHHKEFFYYYKVFVKAEPLIILGIVPLIYISVYLAYVRVKEMFFKNTAFDPQPVSMKIWQFRESFFIPLASVQLRFACFMLLTSALNFLVYSYVPYKTPWLIINITAPCLFGIAVLWSEASALKEFNFKLFFTVLLSNCIFFYFYIIHDSFDRLGPAVSTLALIFVLTINLFGLKCRLSSLVTMLILIVVSAFYSLKFNFRENILGAFSEVIKPQGVYGDNNPYSYVHAFDRMVELGKDIDSYVERKPDARILIGTTAYWPLPFYLRKHDGKLGYVSAVKSPNQYKEEYGVLILNPSVKMDDENWTFEFYDMSDNQKANVYFKK